MGDPIGHDFKVSLVVNAYNSARTIRRALDSAVGQTLSSLEIICVDDGSTDATADIAGEYRGRHPNFRLLPLKSNVGLLSARKAGVAMARGEYLMFLDGDDWLLPEAAAELADLMDARGVDGICFGADYEAEADTAVDAGLLELLRGLLHIDHERILTGHERIVDSCFLRFEFSWNVWNKVYRLERVREIFLNLPDRHLNFDDFFISFLTLARMESLLTVPKRYYRYMVGRGISNTLNTRGSFPKQVDGTYASFVCLRDLAYAHPTPEGMRAIKVLRKELLENYYEAMTVYVAEDRQYATLLSKTECYGIEETVRMFLAYWPRMRNHPLKFDFYRVAVGWPSPRISKVDVVGLIFSADHAGEVLLPCVRTLSAAGFRVVLFASPSVGQAVSASGADCDFKELLPGAAERAERLERLAEERKVDAFVIWFETGGSVDLDLIVTRLLCRKPTVVYLEPGVRVIDDGEQATLCLADAVIDDVGELADGLTSPTGREEMVERFNRLLAARQGIGKAAYGRMCAEADRERDLFRREMERVSSCGAASDPVALVSQSEYFDRAWYLEQNPEVAAAGLDPVRHYLYCGGAEKRDPSPHFDTLLYLEQHPEMKASGENPLLHFLTVGHRSSILPNVYAHPLAETDYVALRESWLFCDEFYRAHFPGRFIADPILHFCAYGWWRDLNPSAGFDLRRYLAENPDVLLAGANPLLHYLTVGKRERRGS